MSVTNKQIQLLQYSPVAYTI